MRLLESPAVKRGQICFAVHRCHVTFLSLKELKASLLVFKKTLQIFIFSSNDVLFVSTNQNEEFLCCAAGTMWLTVCNPCFLLCQLCVFSIFLL